MSVADTVGRLAPGLRESWVSGRERWVDLLRQLVDLNTFADNVAGIDAERALLRPDLQALGFEVEEPPGDPEAITRPRARHLVARRPRPGAPRVLLIAHLDTVFQPDDPFQRLDRRGDVLQGPGVGDIKGGVVSLLAALTALADSGAPAPDVTIVLGSDEEAGSQTSRALLRELALECDVALGFEPAFHPAGESVERHSVVQHVERRKGCGRYSFELSGVAAHSGGAHHLGVSAIEALARKVVEVHALTDRSSGVTTNVGLVSGGRSANTVAPWARGEVDFRFEDAGSGERTAQRLREILERAERVNPDHATAVTCRIERGGGLLWPPLVPSEPSRALSRRIIEVSAALGVTAAAIARGGASDAAHAAAVGRPAVCGLGPVTSGIHTDDETTSVPALGVSATVAAALMATLAE